MDVGQVNDRLEAIVSLVVFGPTSAQAKVDAIFDSGFGGELTLPLSVIQLLDLEWHSLGTAELANGQVEECDVYSGWVDWLGQLREVRIECAETDPLLGCLLVENRKICIQMKSGGDVEIH